VCHMSSDFTKWKIPLKYFKMLPESLRTGDDEFIVRLRNSILWFFYLYDLSREEREKIIKELLKIDYLKELKLVHRMDPVGIFLYFSQKKLDKIRSWMGSILEKAKQYKRIQNPRLLFLSYLSIFTSENPIITENEKKLLVEIARNPAGSLRKWSKNIGLSLSGTKKIYERLREKSVFRIPSILNYAALKLKHYFIRISGVREHGKKLLKEKFQKIIWCRSTFGVASNPNLFFISLTVPAHSKCISFLLETLEDFERFGNITVYEVEKNSTSTNLSLYSVKDGWKISLDDWITFSSKFRHTPSEWTEFIHKVSNVRKLTSDVKLFKGDLYIISNLYKNFTMDINILSEVSGYSPRIVQKKKQDFLKRKIVVPYLYPIIKGIDNEAIIVFDEKNDFDYLIEIFAYFPLVFGYKLRDIFSGKHSSFLYVKLCGSILWDFIRVCNVHRKKLGIKEIYYEYQGTYSKALDGFVNYWNEKKQHWNWSEEDFVKKMEV